VLVLVAARIARIPRSFRTADAVPRRVRRGCVLVQYGRLDDHTGIGCLWIGLLRFIVCSSRARRSNRRSAALKYPRLWMITPRASFRNGPVR